MKISDNRVDNAGYFPMLCLSFLCSNPFFQFENIGKEDGLSQVTINDIYQDQYGFIWLATQKVLTGMMVTNSGYLKIIHSIPQPCHTTGSGTSRRKR